METCKECGGELPHCDCQDDTSVFYVPRLRLDYVCSCDHCYNEAVDGEDYCHKHLTSRAECTIMGVTK